MKAAALMLSIDSLSSLFGWFDSCLGHTCVAHVDGGNGLGIFF